MYLGIDVGSVSTNLAIIKNNQEVFASLYLRTEGNPILAVKKGLKILKEKKCKGSIKIKGVGVTGSARHVIGILVKANVIKNEIICHALSTLKFVPAVQTIIEIGGQDSKIIIIRDGIPVDFSMNTVCAAGTGSFLDHQAQRLHIPIEKFGDYALRSKTKVNIAGRCTVFAETDMVHKQQLGFSKEDIINGLCEAIVRNYLNNVGKGKQILSPVVLQGGVAANRGVIRTFEKTLKTKIIVPKYYNVMGAIGAALVAKEEVEETQMKSDFDFNITEIDFETKSFECRGCPNCCEIIEVLKEKQVIERMGSRCGKWEVRRTEEKYARA